MTQPEELPARPVRPRTTEAGGTTRDELIEWFRTQPDEEEFLRGCYLDLPAVAAAERFLGSEEWRATMAWIGTHPGRALDLGAGHGIASYALARSGWRVTALEPSGSASTGATAVTRLAHAGGLAIETLRATGERLPFASATFDVVYSRQVLHHVADLEAVAREIHRVLRPAGVHVACAEHVISGERQRQRFLRDHPTHRYSGGENAYRAVTYRRAFQAAGLEVAAVLRSFDSPINYAPYTTSGVRTGLEERISQYPGGARLARLLSSGPSFTATLWLLSRLDRRPGRAYSFVNRRPS